MLIYSLQIYHHLTIESINNNMEPILKLSILYRRFPGTLENVQEGTRGELVLEMFPRKAISGKGLGLRFQYHPNLCPLIDPCPPYRHWY